MAPSAGPAAVLAIALLAAARLDAQGLPRLAPINPLAASRSGVYFQPYVDPAPGTRVETALDYGSLIEAPSDSPGTVLDAEVMRLELALAHDLGQRGFVLAAAAAGSAWDGCLDRLVDAYHRAFGIAFPERDLRPRNRFLYQLTLPGEGDDLVLDRAPSALFLGDLRLAAGRRHGKGTQSVLSLTLPSATGPRGYGRGTISVSLLNTMRRRFGSRLTYEGSLGLGYTPEHGDLARFEREGFVALTSGLSLRVFGQQSIYGNLFVHSPYYHDTGVRALDRKEVSLDFGWIGRTAAGREWRIGLTEDLKVGGPAVDLVFRLGVRF